MSDVQLLSSREMARFVARGFLRFDAVVPEAINEQFMAEAGSMPAPSTGKKIGKVYGEALAANQIPEVPAGTPLAKAYAPGSAISKLLALPLVAGAFESLLGPDPVFDHHFLHIAFPPDYHAGGESVSQHTHQDSTIDPKEGFDVQLMYYPHAIARDMGGTRFVPGTHLRKVSEVAVGRYQNMLGQQHMVCEAGTLLFLHHGVWHGGGANRSDSMRYMFKIRARASGRQTRRWAIDDYAAPAQQRAIYYLKSPPERDTVETILTTPEPWFEQDTGRLEYINRIKLWRYLTEDPNYDADYWMTRLAEPTTIRNT
jgi:phytanoyl-CoA dioxygenase PhyH